MAGVTITHLIEVIFFFFFYDLWLIDNKNNIPTVIERVLYSQNKKKLNNLHYENHEYNGGSKNKSLHVFFYKIFLSY